MDNRKRRECCVLGQCMFFMALEQYNQRIVEKHKQVSGYLCNQGVKVLKTLTEEYLKSKRKWQNQPPTFQMPPNMLNQQNLSIFGKKQLVSESSEPSFTQPKKYHSFDKSEQQMRQGSFHVEKSKRKRMTEADELRESLKKLDLQDRSAEDGDGGNEGENEENVNCLNLQQLKNKSISDMIFQSNRKMEERLALKKSNKALQQHNSSDESYPITDYSSNESSNQNQYDQYQKSEQRETKKPPITYSVTSVSQSSVSSSYQPMKLMYSPKKSKSKAKRTYIRNKKIPRWAQKIEQVNAEVQRQRNDPRFDPNAIYGVCLVERLDTNVIFNQEQIYHRGSSAKWNRNPFNQFVS